jgi:hypothetical protein
LRVRISENTGDLTRPAPHRRKKKKNQKKKNQKTLKLKLT